MTDCIFCKIIHGDIPSTKVYEDDLVYAFRDISPQAPVHILLVPKKHIASLAEVTQEDQPLLGHIMHLCGKIAGQEGLTGGFRVVTNIGSDGCQSVPHLHFHILGGEKLTDRMG